ncbi:MAG: hypothetical protein AAFQ57_14110 [Cyanobacteria bacterium J06626_14]
MTNLMRSPTVNGFTKRPTNSLMLREPDETPLMNDLGERAVLGGTAEA